MKMWTVIATGLLTLTTVTPRLWAQVPPVPAVPAVPAAEPTTLLSLLGLSHEQLEKCREKLCAKPCGQLLAALMKPIAFKLGGICGELCPADKPSKEEQEKPGAEGVAAKIKAEEANAKARREAVRFLGTVPCHYFPEAQDALIGALRTDRNECVRMEAAWAIGSGCCCTKKTIEALILTVNSSDKDGHPAEVSERVKVAAFKSLNHCLCCFVEKAPADPKKDIKEVPVGPMPEKPNGDKPVAGLDSHIQLTSYYREDVERKPREQLIAEARQALARAPGAAPASVATHPALRTGERSMLGLVAMAMGWPEGEGAEENSEGTVLNETVLEPAVAAPVVSSAPLPVENRLSPSVPQPMASPFSMAAPKLPVASPAQPLPGAVTSAAQPLPMPAPRHVSPPVPAKPSVPVVKPAVPALPSVPAVAPKPVAAAPASPIVQTAFVPSAPAKAPASMPVADKPMAAPAAKPASAAAALSSRQLVGLLRDSVYPFQREWAAQSLPASDWQGNPDVIPTLCKAAREDASPAVRVECVRSLGQLKVSKPEVLSTLEGLKSDRDPRVRQEVEQTLARMGVYSAAPPTQPAKPLSSTLSGRGN